MHLLLIEDDMDLGRALQSALRAEDCTSVWHRRATDARRAIEDAQPDCVLLDLSLPDGTGFDLLHHWRRHGMDTPIIIMTARSALEDRLMGLDGGADDFIVKPFAIPELLSCVRAVTRRYARQSTEIWTIGALEIDPKRHLACLDGQPLALSRSEFRLLLELSREPGVVVRKGALSRRLSPLGESMEYGALEVHVSNLRRKIGHHRIRTVRGVGYTLTP